MYKVGDKVQIKSIDWYNKNKNPDYGFVYLGNGICFYSHMSTYCGKTMTISKIFGCCYVMVGCVYDIWTDEMIEGLVESIDCKKCGLIRMSTKCLFMDNCPYNQPKNTIEIPKDWVLKDENGNIINTTKIVLEKKKKEYPKTYEECCTVLRFHYDHYLTYDDEKDINPTKEEEEFINLMDTFSRLIVCRNAYWKLYGDEMGLGKPWEYDCKSDYFAFAIIYRNGWIQKVGIQHKNAILAFPTEEMRDAFKENFGPDIEFCKEFL